MSTFQTGQLIAERFRIQRFIGQGGMGEVYEAFDSELKERVALKTIRTDIALDRNFATQLKQEVQAARRVTHSNVCRLFDIARHRFSSGTEKKETIILTMELLKGETLAERLARTGKMSPEEALPLVIQMLDGLTAAHGAGVVHRDFKPSNIMLVTGKLAGSRVVITDFGLARRFSTADTRMTETIGPVIGFGTPAYMAPEQVERGESSPASDIYAFGIVLFEMLTGTLPFNGSNPMQIAAARLRNDPPAPSSYTPELTRNWDEIVSWCLQKEPKNRPSDAATLQERLVTQSVPPRVVGRRKWVHRRAVALASLIAIVFALALLKNVLWTEPPDPKSRTVDSRTLEPNANLTISATELYAQGIELCDRADPKESQKGIANFEAILRVDPNDALTHAAMANCYSLLNDYGGMPHQESIEKATSWAQRAVGLDTSRAEVYASLGLALSLDLRNWKEAEKNFLRAIELNPQYADAHRWYAAMLVRTGQQAKAVAAARTALRSLPTSRRINSVLAWMLFYKREYEEASTQTAKAISFAPEFRAPHLLLARIRERQGRFDDAEAEAKWESPTDKDTSTSDSLLGCIFASRANRDEVLAAEALKQGRRKEHEERQRSAQKNRQEALKKAKSLESRLATEHFPVMNIAIIYGLLGDKDSAFNWLQKGEQSKDSSILFIKVEPYLDGLRLDPRYKSLLESLGLPDDSQMTSSN